MKVDIYNSGARPEWRLIVRTGQPVAALVDDLITGVSTMLPLTLLASGVVLHAAVPGRRAKAIVRFIEEWRGAVARTGDFDDSRLSACTLRQGEDDDD